MPVSQRECGHPLLELHLHSSLNPTLLPRVPPLPGPFSLHSFILLLLSLQDAISLFNL